MATKNLPSGDTTAEEHAVIMGLRKRGFAVVIWTAGELREADAHKVEDRLIELSSEVIDDLQDAG